VEKKRTKFNYTPERLMYIYLEYAASCELRVANNRNTIISHALNTRWMDRSELEVKRGTAGRYYESRWENSPPTYEGLISRSSRMAGMSALEPPSSSVWLGIGIWLGTAGPAVAAEQPVVPIAAAADDDLAFVAVSLSKGCCSMASLETSLGSGEFESLL